jgi:hypothetical protein
MKTERLLILLTIIGIFIIIFLSNFTQPIISGEIEKIKVTKNSIQLKIINYSENIILINKTKIDFFKVGNKIEVYGNKEISINKTIIFVNKLVCNNCNND